MYEVNNKGKEIVFWGAGIQGEKALKKYRKKHNNVEKLIGFLDSKKKGDYMGYPILSIDSVNREDTTVVITVGQSKAIVEIFHLLKEYNFKHIYWFIDFENETSEDFLVRECLNCELWKEPIMPQVEMHVADFCNLNCKGCAHFSPIFEKKLPDTNKRLEDVRLLKSKFAHIVKFYLLGGEPFVNPDIDIYITEIRKILPDTMIQIVTNGLLIPKLSESTFKVIRDNKIIISISEYEPTHRMIEKIESVLMAHQIMYSVRPYSTKDKFIKPLSLSEHSKYPNKCISNGCVNIWDGKISRCPTLMYIDKFNSVFNSSLPNNGIYSLAEIATEDILSLTQKEVPLCKHCIDYEIDWSRCGTVPNIYDFTVDE